MRLLRPRTAGVAALLVLLALAIAGIVIGVGSDSLVVTGGIAQTSDISAEWQCSWTNDDGVTTVCGGDGFGDEPAGDDALDPHGSFDFPYASPFVEKDVGNCNAEIPTPSTDPESDLVAIITIGNAYPSYECTFSLVISNTGSIPFGLSGGNSSVEPPLELHDDACDISESELQEGERATVQCTIHVMEEALQGQAYGFTISPCAAPCGEPVVRRSIPEEFGTFTLRRALPASIGLSISSVKALD